jgi:ribosomal protein S26
MVRYYKRGWSHTKTRGKEGTVTCGFCGRRVPKYKTFPVVRSFGITDPMLKKELGFRRGHSLFQNKIYACPACARHRNIVRKKR